MAKTTPEQRKKWRLKNLEKIAEYRKKYRKMPRARYAAYKYSARERGFTFELSEDEFTSIISSLCYYCGSSSNIGIDRKDNALGYTIKNSAPCCFVCNRMKCTMSHIEFIKLCERIVENRGRER